MNTPLSLHCYIPAPTQGNFLVQSVKASFPLHHTDCCVDFDWLHQSLSGYSGAGDSEVPLSCFLWQKLLWMEEWPLSVRVSPRGQLGEIIRQDSYRQTDAFNQKVVAPSLRLRHICRNFRGSSVIFHKVQVHFCASRTFFFSPQICRLFPFPFAHKEEFQLNWKGGRIVCPWQNLYEP